MDDCLHHREKRDSVIGGFRVVPGGRGRESEGVGGAHLYIYIYDAFFVDTWRHKTRTVKVR